MTGSILMPVVVPMEPQLMLGLLILNLILTVVLQMEQVVNIDTQLMVETLGQRLVQNLQFRAQVFQQHLEHVQILRRRHRLLL